MSNDLRRLLNKVAYSINYPYEINLTKYDLEDGELSILLKNITKQKLDYKLNRSSTGVDRLKVYKRVGISEGIREFIAMILMILACLLMVIPIALNQIFVYPVAWLATYILEGHGLTLKEFYEEALSDYFDE